MRREVARLRMDDLVASRSRECAGTFDVIRADTLEEVVPVMGALQEVLEQGRVAVGFVGYEASRMFVAHPDETAWHHTGEGLPHAWFALMDELPRPSDVQWPELAVSGYSVTYPWVPTMPQHDFMTAVDEARARIANGDFYQCNLTTSFRADFHGDPLGLYRDLVVAMRPAWAMMIATPQFAVCSASPELMVRTDGDHVECQPMKGTCPASADPLLDATWSAQLSASAKDRAENVMIVDLIRNDLARICQVGSVAVPSLCRAERYPSVWQLVSTVEGRLRPDVTPVDVLQTLVPCGSITGAPKLASMRAIDTLEREARGVYCGTMGYLTRHATRLNVAIRTAQVDRLAGQVTYGAGGGITWLSEPASEWRETLIKSRILQAAAPADLAVLETCRYRLIHGRIEIDRLDEHVERAVRTCHDLGWDVDRQAILAAIAQTATRLPEGALRLSISPTGIETSTRTFSVPDQVRLAIASHTVASSDPWRRVKTTHRVALDEARRAQPDVDDVVFLNEHQHCTETSIFTLFAKVHGRWVTPPLSAGCLPGIERARLLRAGSVREATITLPDLQAADQVAVANSVRGWIPAQVTTDPERPTPTRLP